MQTSMSSFISSGPAETLDSLNLKAKNPSRPQRIQVNKKELMKRILTIAMLALATASARAGDNYPGRDFKFSAGALQTEIEHYAEVDAVHFVEAVIDDPSKLDTHRSHLLEFGKEHATDRGLSGQKAEWYANTYAGTLEHLLVKRDPKVGPADVLGMVPVFLYTSDAERMDELEKTGDNDAVNAILNDRNKCATLEYGAKIYIEDMRSSPGIARIHVSGNPQVLYVRDEDLQTGIKQ
jgi:hypothetical protein